MWLKISGFGFLVVPEQPVRMTLGVEGLFLSKGIAGLSAKPEV
jgi:hypothetical protein